MKWDKTAARSRTLRDKRTGGKGGGAVAGGVGGVSLIGLLLYLFLGIGDGSGIPDAGALGPGAAVELSVDDPSTLDEGVEVFVNAVVSDVSDFWVNTFAEYGVAYQDPSFTFFDTPISTACGGATAAIGPHYCSLDKGIYLELGFLEVMRNQLGAGEDFAVSYVIAHEFAHHVQQELGISDWMRAEVQYNPRIQNQYSVRLELQADCLAGVWAQSLPTEGEGNQGRAVYGITDTDIVEALDAAASVGDDRIQQQSAGRVNKEAWTHGSSEQRQEWFYQGYTTGNTEACDTFADV